MSWQGVPPPGGMLVAQLSAQGTQKGTLDPSPELRPAASPTPTPAPPAQTCWPATQGGHLACFLVATQPAQPIHSPIDTHQEASAGRKAPLPPGLGTPPLGWTPMGFRFGSWSSP